MILLASTHVYTCTTQPVLNKTKEKLKQKFEKNNKHKKGYLFSIFNYLVDYKLAHHKEGKLGLKSHPPCD